MTDDHLMKWCQSLLANSETARPWPSQYHTANYDLLKPHHVDLLLNGGVYAAYTTLMTVDNMTTEQIDFGLNHASPKVREAAYTHRCCTDSQRVKFHLKWGNNGLPV